MGCTGLNILLTVYSVIIFICFSDDTAAVERIAYEFCEDEASSGVLYFEARYNPHSLCTGHSGQLQENQSVSPREIVEAVNRGLKRGERDFGVKARSILCCMRHEPGNYTSFLNRPLTVTLNLYYPCR